MKNFMKSVESVTDVAVSILQKLKNSDVKVYANGEGLVCFPNGNKIMLEPEALKQFLKENA